MSMSPKPMHDRRYPNESEDYRAARDRLLAAEAAMRQQIEDVAQQRRQLPVGGPIKEDYPFERATSDGAVETVRLSELLSADRETLVIYSYMFRPDTDNPGYPFGAGPCPMCTSLIDGLDAQAPHVRDRVELVVAAKAPIEAIVEFARGRGWRHVPLLSSAKTTYDVDYLAENADGAPMPMINVFVRRNGGIHHFWGSELLYAHADGQPRHVDSIWPLWNILDLSPEGRGTDWYPKRTY